ncbi:MAG: WYL domain-containing protein, partial [Rubrivivax sp.]
VATLAARPMNLPHFQAIGTALLRRQRAVLRYRSRGRDEESEREVSPQRLIHYRDNWYLDAWCHLRGALRSFSVDAVTAVQVLERRSLDVPERELDEALGAGYGIFGGREVQWATLRFSRERARWVAAERWHPEQHGRWDAEGRWMLSVPYSDPRELVMDILRHVPEVEVIGPEDLQAEVARRLRAGLQAHAGLDE